MIDLKFCTNERPDSQVQNLRLIVWVRGDGDGGTEKLARYGRHRRNDIPLDHCCEFSILIVIP